MIGNRLWFWFAGGLLCLALAVPGCSRQPPEQALRAAIDELRQAIESRDARSLDNRLADDFIGPDGMDGEGAARTARLMFLRYRNVGVTLGPADVSINDRHATVRVEAMLTGGQGRVLPDAVRVYEVESGWRLDGDKWVLTSIRWEDGR